MASMLQTKPLTPLLYFRGQGPPHVAQATLKPGLALTYFHVKNLYPG